MRGFLFFFLCIFRCWALICDFHNFTCTDTHTHVYVYTYIDSRKFDFHFEFLWISLVTYFEIRVRLERRTQLIWANVGAAPELLVVLSSLWWCSALSVVRSNMLHANFQKKTHNWRMWISVFVGNFEICLNSFFRSSVWVVSCVAWHEHARANWSSMAT